MRGMPAATTVLNGHVMGDHAHMLSTWLIDRAKNASLMKSLVRTKTRGKKNSDVKNISSQARTLGGNVAEIISTLTLAFSLWLLASPSAMKQAPSICVVAHAHDVGEFRAYLMKTSYVVARITMTMSHLDISPTFQVTVPTPS